MNYNIVPGHVLGENILASVSILGASIRVGVVTQLALLVEIGTFHILFHSRFYSSFYSIQRSSFYMLLWYNGHTNANYYWYSSYSVKKYIDNSVGLDKLC